MKKISVYIILTISILLLSGCGKTNHELTAEKVKKLELTGNLITYQAYYHNVIEYNKSPHSGILNFLEKERRLFVEYNGTIKIGISLSKVKIKVDGNKINIFIPKAKVIGEPNIDKTDFDAKKFIESKDGLIIKNPITADDSTSAFDKAQKELKEAAMNDEELLSQAQKRAKILIEEKINQLNDSNKSDLNISWEYEQ